MKKFVTFVISSLIATTLLAPTVSPYNMGLTKVYAQTQSLSNAETMANIILEQYGASSIQYALMDNGNLTISNTIQSSLTPEQGLNNESIYGVGSVSKMYTTAAIMSLVDKNILDIDEPLIKYIPDFKMADERYKEITPRMLLNHSSGIYGTYSKEAFLFEKTSRYNHDNLLKVLETQNLKQDPGYMSEYCNDGFSLLEILIERLTNMDYSDYLMDNFINPLELALTNTSTSSIDTSKLAHLYLPPYENALPFESTNLIGTGGFYSNAEEICKFANILIGNEESILTMSSAIAMQNEEYKKGVHAQDNGENMLGHGLGWDNVNAEPFQQYNIKALFKGGDTIQYHTALIAIPEYNLIAAVTSTGGSSLFNYSLAVELLENALLEKGIIDEIIPIKTPEVQTLVELPVEMKAFSGTYAGMGGTEFNLEIGEEIEIPLISNAPMRYIGDGKFGTEDGTIILSFLNNGNDTFIQLDAYSNIYGLKEFASKSLVFQKIEPHYVPQNVLNIWNKRLSQGYVLLDEPALSEQYFFAPPIAIINLNEETGYVYGGAKIIDQNTAVNVLKFRDVADLEFYTKDNVEYLQLNGFNFIGSNYISSISDIQSSSVIIQQDGFTKWYTIEDMSGKEINIDIPKNGVFFVYDELGTCIHHSIVNTTNNVTLPENGLIGFAGNPNDTFYINYK